MEKPSRPVGIYDRPYYEQQHRAGPMAAIQTQSMVVKLIIINAAVWLINGFTTDGIWLADTMSVSAQDLFRPLNWWKFLTAGFAHSPDGPWHVFWNMYGLWLFGRDVERKYGSREFLTMYLISVVVASAGWAVIHQLTAPNVAARMLGASGAVMAVTMLFILNFPQRKFLLLFFPFPVPAWALGLLYIGADVAGVGGLRSGNVAFTAHLIGAACGAAYYFLVDLQKWSLPKLNFGNRSKLKVFQPQNRPDNLDREADKVLDKLNEHGIDSLTPAERKTLDAYSRRMKQKHS